MPSNFVKPENKRAQQPSLRPFTPPSQTPLNLLAYSLFPKSACSGDLRSDACTARPLLRGTHPVIPIRAWPLGTQLFPQFSGKHPSQAREEVCPVQQSSAILHVHQICLAWIVIFMNALFVRCKINDEKYYLRCGKKAVKDKTMQQLLPILKFLEVEVNLM